MNTSLPAAKPPVIDGHVDLLYHLLERRDGLSFADIADGPLTPAGLQRGNVRVLVCALYCSDAHNGPDRSLPYLRKLLEQFGRLTAPLSPIADADALAATLGGSGPPGSLLLLENADALADLGDFSELTAWGIRAVGLTHAGRNRLACGNAVADPSGLTPTGVTVARDLARLGIALDVAHLAEPGFYQLLDLVQAPLFSSHTGLRRFCDRPRNLDEEQLQRLFERGGVVGLSLAPEMLVDEGRADLDIVVAQLDWLVQRFGAEGVAIGSDFGGFDGRCFGLEEIGDFDFLAEKLGECGYPSEAVAGILGGNWQRFYEQQLSS